MFERFTSRARQVVVLAQDESRSLQHSHIGTEHLLLGLLREEGGIGAQVLKALNIDLAQVRDQISREIPSQQAKAGAEIPFTPAAKHVLELALREALALGHNYIGTEHILLGLMREGDGLAFRIITAHGATPESVKHEVISRISNGSGEGRELATAGGGRTASSAASKLLDQFGRNLTALAQEDKLDPVIGRQTEIERVMQILARRTKNNPVLIGEPGVGKTAIVEGLAQKIASGDVPEMLLGKQLYTIDMGAIVAGTKYRGEFEERMKKVIKEATERNDIILFIDEIHTLVGAGAAEGAIDASSILKPPLARGEMQVIGATTLDEFRKYLERDAALERRFQQVKVDEPSVEDTVLILKGLRPRYEDHHKVEITDAALKAAAELASRYIQDRQLPDKAIDLIDEAASRLQMKAGLDVSPELRRVEDELTQARREKEQAIETQEFEKAAELRERESRLKQQKKEIESGKPEAETIGEVGEDEIADIVSMWTGIPVFKLTEAESKRLVNMDSELHKRVIGQEQAIQAVSKAIRRSRAGIKDPKRPTGSFLFLGPSGVGKTELAKTLAEFLFGDEDSLVQLDMSEYMEKHSVSRLVGAPPGYIGHTEGGQLTEAVRRKPYSVLLLDEIEKAHPDVANILLQVLEEGSLTDAQGRKVDFRNVIVIMTSNVGASEITRNQSFGFTVGGNDGLSQEEMKQKVTTALKQHFRPELLNRIDEVIVFQKLTKEEILEIVDLMLQRLRTQMATHEVTIELSDAAKELLVEKGYDPMMGARPLRRAIQTYIEDPLADFVLGRKLEPGQMIVVSRKTDEAGQPMDEIEVTLVAAAAAAPAPPALAAGAA